MSRLVRLRRAATPLAFAALSVLGIDARASVRVVVGPTPIVDGAAHAAHDISVVNEKLAFALAVESPVPYGVPRGAIVDVAPVVNGVVGHNKVVFADFIPNNWSAWPNTYQHVDILERGPQRAVIRTVRDFGQAILTTTYTLASGSDHIDISCTLENAGKTPLTNLLSGLTLWPKSGYLFAVPGLAGVTEGDAKAALAKRFVVYDADWVIALHAPYLDHVGSDSRDLLELHSLAPGQSRTFTGALQVAARGDLKPVLQFEAAQAHEPTGLIAGHVTDAQGQDVPQPVIVIEKAGKPFGWVVGESGHYDMTLPAGEYRLYATAKSYSDSPAVSFSVAAGAHQRQDFGGLQRPGHLRLSVEDAQSARPLDARIVIAQGQQPLVEYLGRRTFFTELDRPGRLALDIAPGHYVFDVSHGGGFLAPRVVLAVEVRPDATERESVRVHRLFEPSARGWYSADLHHHADQAEAITPPPDVARSQLAAGLDVLFVSDHDSTVNHAAMIQIARERGVTFIPSVEMSPSWGHFNAYPMHPGERLAIDSSTASIDDILREAHRLGALVVQVNHPFIPYGYFQSLRAGVAPGGFNPGFDLVEINATVPQDDSKVLQVLWHFWNDGHRYYLSAGTDTHDVWTDESGRIRTFAHPSGALSAESFTLALKAGHGYVSRGPLIYPQVDFGDTIHVRPGDSLSLAFDIESVPGLKLVELIENGTMGATRSFRPAPASKPRGTEAAGHREHLQFTLRTVRSAWVSLSVEDQLGHRAYTDPIWIDVVDDAASAIGFARP